MNKKQITHQKKKLSNLYEHLRHEVSSSTMDLITELVELEILLERECNK